MEKVKRKPGRRSCKNRPESERLVNTIVMLTVGQREKIDKYAFTKGISRSYFIRAVIDDALFNVKANEFQF